MSCTRIVDSVWERHLVCCTGIGVAPTDPDTLATYLAELADRPCVGKPNLTIPIAMEGETEIDMGALLEERDVHGGLQDSSGEEDNVGST